MASHKPCSYSHTILTARSTTGIITRLLDTLTNVYHLFRFRHPYKLFKMSRSGDVYSEYLNGCLQRNSNFLLDLLSETANQPITWSPSLKLSMLRLQQDDLIVCDKINTNPERVLSSSLTLYVFIQDRPVLEIFPVWVPVSGRIGSLLTLAGCNGLLFGLLFGEAAMCSI